MGGMREVSRPARPGWMPHAVPACPLIPKAGRRDPVLPVLPIKPVLPVLPVSLPGQVISASALIHLALRDAEVHNRRRHCEGGLYSMGCSCSRRTRFPIKSPFEVVDTLDVELGSGVTRQPRVATTTDTRVGPSPQFLAFQGFPAKTVPAHGPQPSRKFCSFLYNFQLPQPLARSLLYKYNSINQLRFSFSSVLYIHYHGAAYCGLVVAAAVD